MAEPEDVKKVTLRLDKDVVERASAWGVSKGLTFPRGDVRLSETLENIVETFLALEAAGEHVNGLIESAVTPLESRLVALLVDLGTTRRMVRRVLMQHLHTHGGAADGMSMADLEEMVYRNIEEPARLVAVKEVERAASATASL